ncbi:uncharacterized protein Z518_08391 [Rhinocladiella mackenziei CBS 650.93]|uniref:Uncharacterized protein n=1 Tax=Rhinocladiella mackenziei CBS 650.93 TaxID=1442369 RepID=A0A0D2J0P2_9EURO|nr:uncharacterized protein Z518_08391 [Rhinocladiella mackenziei CBS 650.93]KIX02450.1 hypothetical protein Z518_08391 [Rhinocladiella mackenziei CBS 650.93]
MDARLTVVHLSTINQPRRFPPAQVQIESKLGGLVLLAIHLLIWFVCLPQKIASVIFGALHLVEQLLHLWAIFCQHILETLSSAFHWQVVAPNKTAQYAWRRAIAEKEQSETLLKQPQFPGKPWPEKSPTVPGLGEPYKASRHPHFARSPSCRIKRRRRDSNATSPTSPADQTDDLGLAWLRNISISPLQQHHGDLNRNKGIIVPHPSRLPRSGLDGSSSAAPLHDNLRLNTPPHAACPSAEPPPPTGLTPEAPRDATLETEAEALMVNLSGQLKNPPGSCFRREPPDIHGKVDTGRLGTSIASQPYHDAARVHAREGRLTLGPRGGAQPLDGPTQKLPIGTEPKGIIQAAGPDCRKRRRSASQTSRLRSTRARTRNNNPENRPSEYGSDDADDEEEEGDPDPHDTKAGRVHNKNQRRQLRCPKYAANPEHCDSKCQKWSSDKIATVTRHAKRDAKDDPEKLQRIEELSHSKLSPEERWQKYYEIFGGSNVGQMGQPFRVLADAEDKLEKVLNMLEDRLSREPSFYGHITRCMRVLKERKKRYETIMRWYKREKAKLQTQVEHKLDELHASYEQDLASLEAQLSGSGPPGTIQHRISGEEITIPEMSYGNQDDLLLYPIGNSSAQNLYGQDDPVATDPNQRTASSIPPVGMSTFNRSDVLNPVQQSGVQSQRLPQIFDTLCTTDKVMDPHTRPAERRQLVQQHLERQRQPHGLHPPHHPAYHADDSGYGSHLETCQCLFDQVLRLSFVALYVRNGLNVGVSCAAAWMIIPLYKVYEHLRVMQDISQQNMEISISGRLFQALCRHFWIYTYSLNDAGPSTNAAHLLIFGGQSFSNLPVDKRSAVAPVGGMEIGVFEDCFLDILANRVRLVLNGSRRPLDALYT